jgi:sensor domain CHASE-containing protein
MNEILPVWITSGFSVIGVIYAIVRNGRRQKKQDEQLRMELTSEIKSVKAQLEDPVNGLSSIKTSVDNQKIHCAEVSTRITTQVNTNIEEIAMLRKKR